MAHINLGFNLKWFIIFTLLICFATPALSLMDPHMQSPVPDTGQRGGYTTTFGEDSDYSTNPMSFTKLDASGNTLPDDATEWTMVRDNITGLVWEAKESKDGIPDYKNPHDADNTYTWYDPNPDTNGGVAGTRRPEDKNNTLDFINAMNSQKFGGFADWRIPTREELRSIVNLGRYNPAVNTEYFGDTIPAYYWSANTFAANTNYAWKLDFYAGGDSNHLKSGSFHARAVRSGQSRLSGNLVNNGDGTVTDTNTGLMWQKRGSGEYMDWENAIIYAENLTLAGHSDWRLPDQKELSSIATINLYSPAIDTKVFDLESVGVDGYWSGTTYVPHTDSEFYLNGWLVSFVDYGQAGRIDKSNGAYVRCVRQSGLTPSSNSIQFVQNSFTAVESDGSASITLRRLGNLTGEVSVDCISYGGTALKYLDFTLPESTTLTWADGDGSDKILNIQIVNDGVLENNETVHLYLINPKGVTAIGSPASAVLSIGDDATTPSAGILQFQSHSYKVNESDGKLTVTLSRVNGSSGEASVDYALQSTTSAIPFTTATEGDDFTLPTDSHRITWADGDISDKIFDIIINSDDNIEGSEFIVLYLLNQTGGATIDTLSHTAITIIDNSVKNEADAAAVIVQLNDSIVFIDRNMPDDQPPPEPLVDAINRAVEDTGNIIEISNNLMQENKLSVDMALNSLESLGSIIDLGARAAKSGGAVNIDKVAGGMEFVEEIIDRANSQGATAEQMQNSSGNINNMLGNMPDIMNAATMTDTVIKILEPVKGLAGAGIKAAIKGGNDPSKTVNTLGNIVTKGLQEAQDATLVSNTGKIIESAGLIVNQTIDILTEETQDQTIIENTLDQFQVELKKIIEQTALNIKDKTVRSSAVTNAKRSLVRDSDNYILEDFKVLMDNVSVLTTSMVKNQAVLNSDLSGTMQNLSLEIMNNIIPAFISGNRIGLREGESNIDQLMSGYPQLLNEVIEIASINLTSGMLTTKDDILELIKNDPSLTSAERERLINGLPELPVFDQDIIKSGDVALSLVDLLKQEVEKLLPGSTVEVTSSKGIYLTLMLKNTSIGLQMPLYIQDVRVVSSLIPQGLHILPEGTMILVSNGIAGMITPAPKEPVDIILSLDEIFGSGTEGVDINVSNAGNLNLAFQDGSSFSGSFGYGTSRQGDGDFDAGTSSFEIQGTDPSSELYSVLVVYNDGSTQQISPSIAAIEQLVGVLDTLVPGSYSLDKSTGIFNVLGMRFKPSYFIEPITTVDQSWYNNNKDSFGIAWEANDYNGDGAVDLKMWTLDGKQVIYTVVQ